MPLGQVSQKGDIILLGIQTPPRQPTIWSITNPTEHTISLGRSINEILKINLPYSYKPEVFLKPSACF